MVLTKSRILKLTAALLFAACFLGVLNFRQLVLYSSNKDVRSTVEMQKFMNTGMSKPVHHIAFVKVHKAASTTFQNVLLRYGWKQNLIFLLPKRSPTISMKNSMASSNILPPPKGRTFDISCCHVLYNRTEFEKLLPSDTVYIGIIRRPFEQFVSNVNYGHKKYMLNLAKEKPILEFLKRPDYYTKNGTKGSSQPISVFYNRMAYDLGFPHQLFFKYNATAVQQYLEKLDSEFGLIVIVEYMDQCMVLIRRLLNWRVQDVLYAHLNKGNKKNPLLQVGLTEKTLYEKWSKLDVALYDFFLKKFLSLWSQLKLHSDVEEELLFYRSLRKDFTQFCLNTSDNAKDFLAVEKSKWSPSLTFSQDDCFMFKVREIPFLDKLRDRQSQE